MPPLTKRPDPMHSNGVSLHFKPCHNTIKHNECHVPNCPYQHRLITCKECRVYLPTTALESHLNGRKHATRLSLDEERKTAGSRSGENSIPLSGSPRTQDEFCKLCNVRVSTMATHIRNSEHRQRMRFAKYESAKAKSQKDKQGIVVFPPGEINFGVMDSVQAGARTSAKKVQVTLANKGLETVELLEARMMSTIVGNSGLSSHSRFTVTKPSATILNPDRRIEISVIFDPPRFSGRHDDTLELFFATHRERSKRFKITRPLLCTITDAELHASLAAVSSYVRPERPAYPASPNAKNPNELVPGIKPPALAAIEWKTKLPGADVPPPVRARMRLVGTIAAKLQWSKQRGVVPAALSVTTWGKWWQGALWIEEVQMSEDIRAYDMKNTTLHQRDKSRFYLLDVPGLSEKRPSVLVGDSVNVRESGTIAGKFFEGCVHELFDTKAKLRFNDQFQPVRGQKFDVQFTVSRLPLRRMHAALAGALVHSHTFFPRRPKHVVKPPQEEVNAIRLFDRKLEQNPQQKLAVAAILKPPHPEVPYLVFGPPGTGKTSVIVEAVKQLCEDRSTRILLCAPSNSAADLLASRLMSVKANIFRLCAPSRDPATIRQDVKHLTLQDDSGTFCVPELQNVLQYKVIVCTCISSSVLAGVGVQKGHFSHVFVDEAGQALETEIAIPLKMLQTPETRLILAGDPKQLGPVIRSPVARCLGLDVSLLDRLMSQFAVYKLPDHSGATICKLVQNYRNHPAILQFPNHQFYENELKACADPVETHSLLRWDELPNHNIPCIMHNVRGEDMREASPSFFNPVEICEVRRYVRSLLADNRSLRLTQDDIGIIAPYQAQVAKVRGALKAEYPSIKVGSVEEFQGQERRVIIISTVRSNKNHLLFDVKHNLGFVTNPRRLNVAITRAKAALIVVGDASVLKQDILWLRLMNYLHAQGCWRGEEPDWDLQRFVSKPLGVAQGQTASRSATVLQQGWTERRQGTDVRFADLIRQLESTALTKLEDNMFEASIEKDWRREME